MRFIATIGLGLVSSALFTVPASAQTLTTIFAGGNSLTSPFANTMDITVTNKGGIVIESIDVNCENTRQGGVGTKFDVEVHFTAKGVTYLGNSNTPALWSGPSGTGSSTSNASGTPTNVDITDVFVPPGQWAMGIRFVIPSGSSGTAIAYTNGNGPNQTYSNADLKLDLGSAVTGLFNGSVYNPRVWNGTIYYRAGKDTGKVAALGAFGRGCDGGVANGAPTLAGGAKNPVPKLGGLFDLQFDNLPASAGAGFLDLGFFFEKWGPMNLPADLNIIGQPGCLTYTTPDVLVPFGHPGKSHLLILGVPNTPSAAGVAIGAQALIVDGASRTGATGTNMVGGRIGN